MADIKIKMTQTEWEIAETIKEVLGSDFTRSSSTNILQETGLDSLGLAIVVVRLNEKLKKDPFEDGFVLFHTIEELGALYDNT